MGARDVTDQHGIALAEYSGLINLEAPAVRDAPIGTASLDELAGNALLALTQHDAATAALLSAGDLDGVPSAGRFQLLRDLLTVRPPAPLPPPAAEAVEAYLHQQARRRPTVDPATLPTLAAALPGTAYPAAASTALWRGDITTLAADAIVNAANSALLGCFQPGHSCIDNAIHAAAGPALRADCAAIITAQGHPEPTGTAKVTRGHHLPARFVLHTVGPVVPAQGGLQPRLQPEHERGLVSAYRSCLDLAAQVGAATVAFCSISTGVFGYPKAPAARTALSTVAEWLHANPGVIDLVVFDVFSAQDEAVYLDALTRWS